MKLKLITPDEAGKIWAQILPDPPRSRVALLRRCKRGNGPPAILVRGRGRGTTMFDPSAVRTWCIAQLPPDTRIGLRLLEVCRNVHRSPEAFVKEVDGVVPVVISVSDSPLVAALARVGARAIVQRKWNKNHDERPD